MTYTIPVFPKSPTLEPQTVYLVASGDLRDSANKVCWAAQQDMESKLEKALLDCGWKLKRAHDYDEKLEHGFIWNQRMGMDVFSRIPKNFRRAHSCATCFAGQKALIKIGKE